MVLNDHNFYLYDHNAAASLNNKHQYITLHLVLNCSNTWNSLLAVLNEIQWRLCDKSRYNVIQI